MSYKTEDTKPRERLLFRVKAKKGFRYYSNQIPDKARKIIYEYIDRLVEFWDAYTWKTCFWIGFILFAIIIGVTWLLNAKEGYVSKELVGTSSLINSIISVGYSAFITQRNSEKFGLDLVRIPFYKIAVFTCGSVRFVSIMLIPVSLILSECKYHTWASFFCFLNYFLSFALYIFVDLITDENKRFECAKEFYSDLWHTDTDEWYQKMKSYCNVLSKGSSDVKEKSLFFLNLLHAAKIHCEQKYRRNEENRRDQNALIIYHVLNDVFTQCLSGNQNEKKHDLFSALSLRFHNKDNNVSDKVIFFIDFCIINILKKLGIEQFNDPKIRDYFTYKLSETSSLFYSYEKIILQTKTCENAFFNSIDYQNSAYSDESEFFSPEALQLMHFLEK